MRGSLPLSVAAHVLIIGLLLLLPAALPSAPKLDLSHAVDVVFAPPPAPAPPAPSTPPPPQPVVEQPPPPPPPVEQPPPPPPQPVVEQPAPPPAAQAETPPPPPPKPEPKPKPRPRPIQPVQREPQREIPMPLPTPAAPVAAPAPQVASLPPAAPAPAITPDYGSLLSRWLESHKTYPEEARQRGEEGRAVLRFRVDRTGRVLDYAVVSSTGFGDLDASVQNMMRGASLPPFPPGMTSPEIEVSVTIRFGLTR